MCLNLLGGSSTVAFSSGLTALSTLSFRAWSPFNSVSTISTGEATGTSQKASAKVKESVSPLLLLSLDCSAKDSG